MSFKLNVLLEDIIKFDSFQVHRMETYNVLCRNYWVKSYNLRKHFAAIQTILIIVHLKSAF